MEKYCSIREAAKETNLAESYLRGRLVRGEIAHLKSGAKYLIPIHALLEQLEAESRGQEVQNDE